MAYRIQDSLTVSDGITGTLTGNVTGNLTGTASYTTKADTADTITVNSFASPVESYLLMSNVVATTGVGIGGDSDLRYNSSTNVLTVPNISATTLTGSLFGTSSWATNFVNASNYVLNSATSSMLTPYVLTSGTSSMLAPYVLSSVTSSMLTPYVLTNSTASMLSPYVLTSSTSSMLTPYTLTSVTSSMLAPYLLSVLTSSFATTGSNRFNGNQTITGSVTISSSADPQFVIGNNLLIVSSSGNIGIGTLTPNYKLDIFNGAIKIVPSGSSGPASVALVISGSGTKGGAAYIDFLQVTNSTGSATNPNKYFRVDNTGTLQVLNSAYTAGILSLTDGGLLSVGGGNPASSSNQDATTNYLTFNNNNSQIYDDGNMHIHSRTSGQTMWINTNGGQLNLLTQVPVNGGVTGSGVAIGGDGSLTGYVTINHNKAYTTSERYGYLTGDGAGTYPGGSQTVYVSLYAKSRIWGQEIDAFSDERLKDILGNVSLDEGIKLVKTLQPIKYTWKDNKDGGLKIGYSAQQVAKAGFDNLISLIPKEGLKETIDEDGFVSPKDTQFSMNYDQVTPYHGVVIKHLLEKIEQLEKEIQLLKEE